MKTKAALVLSLITCSGAALAHEGHEHAPATKAPPVPVPAAAPAAPGDHAHPSPHGGIVATVDKDTHIEVLFGDQDMSVWFYDASMKAVAPPADAKATIVVGKEVKKVALPVAKNLDGTATDHLVGAFIASVDAKVSVVVQATVIGKARSARIERAATPSQKIETGTTP